MVNMSRIFRRNSTKLLVGLIVSFLVLLILVKSKHLNTENELLDKNFDFQRIKKVVALENAERIALVKKVCKKYKMGPYKTASYEVQFKEPPAPQYSVFYIDSKHNISYCPIYKSGSTTWIYNLCLLNGISEEELNNGKEQISTIARKIMPEIDYPEAEEIFNKTGKLLIVRHPFERLLSAYRDKLENSVAGREHGTLHFYKKYGASIVRKYRDENRPMPTSDQVILRPGIPKPAGIEPTFREFVDYLIGTNLANYADDHWTPYYLYCTPCLINYDVIAKVETLQRDQAYAIHQFGLNDKIRPRWRHNTHTGNNRNPAEVYFSQLTKEHVEKLYDKFKLDFELFGYTADKYYEFATSVT